MDELIVCPECDKLSVHVYRDITPNRPRYVCESCHRVWNTDEWNEENGKKYEC